MRDRKGELLIPHGWERFWTEHSGRVWACHATEWAGSFGCSKVRSQIVGEVDSEGSDQHVRTYNAVVIRMQAKFADPVKGRKGLLSL